MYYHQRNVSPLESLLRGGKSIFAPWRISYNKIAAGRLISSRSELRGDFPTGDFIYDTLDVLLLWPNMQRSVPKISVTSNSNFDPDYNIFRKSMKIRFQRYIVFTKVISTFHARVDYISLPNMPLKPFGQRGKQPQNPPFPSRHVDPTMPNPLTTPNDSSIGSHTSAQLRNNVPIGYNGTPQIHPRNCPFPLMITTPSNTPIR